MKVIEVKDLKKTFVSKKHYKGKEKWKHLFKKKEKIIKNAVDGITFSVEEGESVALIGPNGAGKSTTIKMLTGILYPTSGDISVLGYKPQKERVKLSYKIGAVFGQKEQLWVHLSAYDNFLFFGSIYEIPKEEMKKRIGEYAKLFEIEEIMYQPVRSMSLGQRMKCEIVASLLHKPNILLFDEPTIGLDPIAKDTLRGLIKKINKELKTTIIFTSHDVGDIEEVCKRVIIVNNGKIVLDDSMNNLKYHYLNKKIVEVKLKKEYQIAPTEGITILKQNGNLFKIEVDMEKSSIDEILGIFKSEDIQDITISSTPLEEIIKTIYKGGEKNG